MKPSVQQVYDRSQGRSPNGNPLSRTEHEVLRLFARGLTTDQIALDLNRSVRTVEMHALRIRKKLGLGGTGTSKGAFILRARDMGLLDEDWQSSMCARLTEVETSLRILGAAIGRMRELLAQRPVGRAL